MITNREGFSLIEVLVAMMILTVGVLAMGASTGFVLNQVRAAELRTDRGAAVRQAAEILRATPWNTMVGGCGGTVDIGPDQRYVVDYECPSVTANLVRIHLISDGPGYAQGRLGLSVQDTTVINIRR